MGKSIKLTKGFDINLEGAALKIWGSTPEISTYALKPSDFHGIKPKLLAKVGDEVKAGSPLFLDKNNPDALFTSPVSGEVVDIVRGDKRKLLEIRILADKSIEYLDLGSKRNPVDLTRDEIVESLLKSGAWPFIRMRPFAKVARPDDKPKAIFISGFDSAPLAPDYNFILSGQQELFQTGIDLLSKLTAGKIHLNVRKGDEHCMAFKNAKGVQLNTFSGPHPSGTIGVQIHHLEPIKKGDIIWYLNPQDVLTIAKVFTDGKFDPQRAVVTCGTELKVRKYYKTLLGASIAPFVKDNVVVNEFDKRYISGSPLFGTKITADGFFGFHESQLTVVREGNQPEFQGWIMPSFPRPSVSSTFPWSFAPDTKFVANTNMHGEERAFIMTGQYEKVLPMDIYPVFLLKAIMAKDIEQMEGLGLLEVTEEEMALCEFACTSKIPVTDIIREGLEIIEQEG